MTAVARDRLDPARVAPLRWVAIVAGFLNLGIHTCLAPMHLQEKLYIGILFLVGSGTLAVVVVGLATDRDRARTGAWLLGSATSAVMFVAFILSRTVGLPGGYLEAWADGPEDVLGLISLALELIFCGCCLASVTTRSRGGAPSRRPELLRWHDRTAPLP